jgi:exopolyphosphatase/pppGpp-phosphohydrolase
MKISIIDIGSKSIKHFVFDGHKQIYFSRDSTIRLGATMISNNLDQERMGTAIAYVKKELKVDMDKSVGKTIICGTEALRRAGNSARFIELLKKNTGYDLRIITHDDESSLFGKGLSRIAPGDFAAFAAGGGSFEAIILKGHEWHSVKFAFGTNKLYEFLRQDYEKKIYNNKESWDRLREFLKIEIDKAFAINEDLHVDIAFVSSVLTFISAQKNIIKKDFETSDIEEHPIFLYIDDYELAIQKLIDAGIERLAANYPTDPHFADHSSIAQTFYLMLAKKLDVKRIYPSEFQYAHGLVEP